jgi:hypothetical protein
MDTSTSLLKATIKADKEQYKKEGRCFFCEVQGHISHGCLKKPSTFKVNPAKLATATTMEEIILTESKEMTPTLNQENVLNYLRDLSNNEYQQMVDTWGKLLMEEDFGQA